MAPLQHEELQSIESFSAAKHAASAKVGNLSSSVTAGRWVVLVFSYSVVTRAGGGAKGYHNSILFS
jgi:hypothetical protein